MYYLTDYASGRIGIAGYPIPCNTIEVHRQAMATVLTVTGQNIMTLYCRSEVW